MNQEKLALERSEGASMGIGPLLALMRQRRSIRSFKPDPVPDASIAKIIEAGRWAPSSANSQPWEFIVVRDQATKEQIQSSVGRCIARIKELRDFPFLRTFTAGYMLEAPVHLVVVGDPHFRYVSMMHQIEENIEQFAFWGSVSMAIQNMLLAITAQGLGTAVFTNFYPEEVKPLLAIPDSLRIVCILPIGYPNEVREPRPRRPADSFTHQERYDQSKMRSDELIERAHRDPYGEQVKEY
jgi:5,6-dimethylbenzimidazole synthase